MNARSASLLASASVLSCWQEPAISEGAAVSPSSMCGRTPAGLFVEPSFSEIDLGDQQTAGIEFRAIGAFDGDIFAAVTPEWVVRNTDAGSIDSVGRFVPSGRAGGQVTIAARMGDQHAEAHLGIRLIRSHGDIPDAVKRAFEGAQPGKPSSPPPSVVAPADRSSLSTDPAGIRFELDTGGRQYVRLRFQSATTDISVYGEGESLPLSREAWEQLGLSNRGGWVRVMLEAIGANDEGVSRAVRPIEVLFCHPLEVCNGMDDDCNGHVDDDCTAIGEQVTAIRQCSGESE